jgi:hypothetical protein
VSLTTTHFSLFFFIALRSRRRENLKSYIALTGWPLQRRRNVFPVRYELSFYIPEVGILHSHRRENIKSYTDILFDPQLVNALFECVEIPVQGPQFWLRRCACAPARTKKQENGRQ